jgi:hypothetical protein
MPLFTAGDWRYVHHSNRYSTYGQIVSDEHPDYLIAEGLLDDESTNAEDRANFRLMSEAARMYTLLQEAVHRVGTFDSWNEQVEAVMRAVEGTVPCGADVTCEHTGGVCVVGWEHTMHRAACGCRQPWYYSVPAPDNNGSVILHSVSDTTEHNYYVRGLDAADYSSSSTYEYYNTPPTATS